MAGTTQVTFAELDSMSKETSTTNDQVHGELNRVKALVDATSASWKGDAHNAFSGVMAQWDADSTKLNNALRAISDALHAASVNFQGQQEQHVAEINKAANAGGSLNL